MAGEDADFEVNFSYPWPVCISSSRQGSFPGGEIDGEVRSVSAPTTFSTERAHTYRGKVCEDTRHRREEPS